MKMKSIISGLQIPNFLVFTKEKIILVRTMRSTVSIEGALGDIKHCGEKVLLTFAESQLLFSSEVSVQPTSFLKL